MLELAKCFNHTSLYNNAMTFRNTGVFARCKKRIRSTIRL